MSDQSNGPGWWLASDGKWYPPAPPDETTRISALPPMGPPPEGPPLRGPSSLGPPPGPKARWWKRGVPVWGVILIGLMSMLLGAAAVTDTPDETTDRTAAVGDTSTTATRRTTTTTERTTTTTKATSSTTAKATTTTKAKAKTTSTTKVVRMPNVVCRNLQDAQNDIQHAGVFLSYSEDATGQGRNQIIDSNWVVVRQTPKPGTPIGEGDATLYVVKYGEPNDCEK